MYPSIVFIHIAAAFFLFALWFLDGIFILKTGTIFNAGRQPFTKNGVRFQMTAMLAVFVSGGFLMRNGWGPQPWLVVSVFLLLSTILVSLSISLLMRKSVKHEETRSSMSFVNTLYKMITALVILNLMVLKDDRYFQVFLKVIIFYGLGLAGSVILYRSRNSLKSNVDKREGHE